MGQNVWSKTYGQGYVRLTFLNRFYYLFQPLFKPIVVPPFLSNPFGGTPN